MNSIELSRVRAQLKLLINRLKLLQQKKTALAKQTRRTLAQALEEKKVESARIRIENLIQEDIHVELLEALEIYTELALARISLISEGEIKDERLREALRVLLYTSQYSDIKELQTLRPPIARLTSKEFVQTAAEDKEGVPPKILAKIHVEVPKPELVDLYLVEIAKAYNVAVPGLYEPEPPVEVEKKEEETPAADEKAREDDIWARFAALKK